MRTINTKNLARLTNAAVVEFLQQVIGEMQILDSESFVQNLVVNFKKAVNNYQTAFCLQSTVSYTAEVQKCANLALRNYVVFRDIAFDSLKSGNPETYLQYRGALSGAACGVISGCWRSPAR